MWLDFSMLGCDPRMQTLPTEANTLSPITPQQWYVEQTLGKGQSKNLFYTDAKCKQAYKNYVKMLINRTNSITGVVYKNDPTIFAWDLMNEVRESSCVVTFDFGSVSRARNHLVLSMHTDWGWIWNTTHPTFHHEAVLTHSTPPPPSTLPSPTRRTTTS